MSQEDLYTTMGGVSQDATVEKSPENSPKGQARPLSRLQKTDNESANMPGSRLSRSQTLMYPSQRAVSPKLQYKPRSPTHIGIVSHDRSLKRMHGSIDNSDCPIPGHIGNSQTLQLQRSMTTKAGASVYGKNLWDEDEYVEPGGSPTARNATPAGGAAARRINQKKMQTVKLPKNPFVDPDYADMTGHMKDAGGMEELRNAHQYRSMKSRSPSTMKQHEFKPEFDDIIRGSSVDGKTRNRSVSSGNSSPQSIFKRSETTPNIQLSHVEDKPTDPKGNGHIANNNRFSIVEVDGTISRESSLSSYQGPAERQVSLKKDPPVKTSSLGQSAKPQLPVSSPAHSTVSGETTSTFLPHSTQASPSVAFRNNANTDAPDLQVAIVIDETGPTSPMHAKLPINGMEEGNRGVSVKRDQSNLKFEDPAVDSQRRTTIILTVLCCILAIGLILAVALLAVKTSAQQAEIQSLIEQLESKTWLAVQTTSGADANSQGSTTAFESFTTTYANVTAITTRAMKPGTSTREISATTSGILATTTSHHIGTETSPPSSIHSGAEDAT